ncbi:MAG: hypothetical protein ACP5FH_03360 [Terracidiphilus sp.]
MAGVLGVAIFLMVTGVAVAQMSMPQEQSTDTQMSVPNGYAIHESLDIGGRIADITGSEAMYDTLVNLQTGPRLMGETFEMHALPGKKNTLIDDLSAAGSGFGGDPYDFAKLDFSKGNVYEFSGIFHRDRQYFDYDLLGNPGIPSGYSIPISGSSAPYAWPQVNQSPFMYNTVRRMTDTNLTVFPLSKVTFHFGYEKDIFQGPSLSPSGYQVATAYSLILQEYQRNSTDAFTAAVDWKPVEGTKLTYEEEVDHNKINSYFTLDPSYLTVQEADGTKVGLLDSFDSYMPYGYNGAGVFSPAANCNTGSMINSSTILYNNPTGGPPIIDPACYVVSNYYRSQPTRELFPTEIFRMQSTSIKNVSMNGDVRYTSANMNLPNYYEDFQGLYKADRELAYTALANAKREVIAVDYGIVWQAAKTVSLSDQVSYSNVHQPGTAEFTSGTTVTVPTTAGEETIDYTPNPPTTVTSGGPPFEGSPSIGTPNYDYFGQKWVTNNATVTWDATTRATFALTYRYRKHDITEGTANNTSSQTGEEVFTINENGGIFNAALRPTDNWDLNGSAEILYDDNVFTPVEPRQTQHYRVHSLYRPKSWATISAAYNDLEQHNNTNNTGTVSLTPAGLPIELGHENHSRVVSLGAALMPNEHYGLDLNYSYSDVYTTTNICFDGAASAMPNSSYVAGVATASGTLCAAVTPNAHGPGYQILAGPTKDFEDAPTQYGSVALALSPVAKLHSNLGYRISSVNGSRFFTDAMDVNGSLVSTYQTPYVNVAWTLRQGLILKADYDYFGYGEGGRSGAQWCADNLSLTSGTSESGDVGPCSDAPNAAMNPATPVYGFTAPRNFHANNVLLAVHYDF